MPTQDPATTAGDDDSLEAVIERNFDALSTESNDAATGADTSASASAETGSQPSSSPEGAGVDAGRARDAAGRFTKAEKAAADKAAADAAAQAQPGAQPSELKIPEKWPPDVKQYLADLHARSPADAQWALKQYEHMRREAGSHVARAQQQLKAFDDLLAPGRQARALKGVDDATHVRHLIAAGDFLDKNPVEGIRHLMKTYGVTPEHLTGAIEAEPQVPEYVQRLAAETAEIKRALHEQFVGAQQQMLEATGSQIQAFASQKDAQGNPLYPYFDEVLPQVVIAVQHQLEEGRQPDLPAAYRTAVRLNEAVWLKEQARQTEANRKAAEAQRLREIEDARKASVSVSGSGAGTTEVVPDDLEAVIARNWEKLSRS